MSRCEYVGKVWGKPRPRACRRGNGVAVYTPAWSAEYESAIAAAYQATGGERHEGPVEVSIKVFRPLPSSRRKSQETEPDTFKPDLDNVCKAVLDALNGIAYWDDRQVTRLVAEKAPRRRGVIEGMAVEVRPATGGSENAEAL